METASQLRFGITTSVTYANFRLSGMLAGRLKATVVNGTKRDMLTRGTSLESVQMREGPSVIFNGVLKDGEENSKIPTRNQIAVDYSTGVYGFQPNF